MYSHRNGFIRLYRYLTQINFDEPIEPMTIDFIEFIKTNKRYINECLPTAIPRLIPHIKLYCSLNDVRFKDI